MTQSWDASCMVPSVGFLEEERAWRGTWKDRSAESSRSFRFPPIFLAPAPTRANTTIFSVLTFLTPSLQPCSHRNVFLLHLY